jgi:hypothetical protein
LTRDAIVLESAADEALRAKRGLVRDAQAREGVRLAIEDARVRDGAVARALEGGALGVDGAEASEKRRAIRRGVGAHSIERLGARARGDRSDRRVDVVPVRLALVSKRHGEREAGATARAARVPRPRARSSR